MKKVLTIAFMMYCAEMVMAQSIDLNMSNRQDLEVNEPGYVSWVIDQVQSQEKTLDNGLKVAIAATGNSNTLRAQWNKNTCKAGQNGQTGLRLMGDGAMAFILDDGNNTPNQTTIPMSISVTIEGFPIGHHSVAAYHVYKDAKKGLMPTIKLDVVRTDYTETTKTIIEDGEEKDITERTDTKTIIAQQSGIEYVCVKPTGHESELRMSDASFSYVEFDIIQEGQPVTITYTTEVEEGKEYQTTCVILNGLLIDRSPVVAMDPTPNNYDYHYDASNGSVTLKWEPATIAVSHKLVWGTDKNAVENATNYQYEGNATSYDLSGLNSYQNYYWRIDEVDNEGKVFKGNVWSFRLRQLAFPEAEGYGRFAQGGRGGIVYHVKNLSGDKSVEGSLPYALVNIDDPRYIVFDVSGIIDLGFEALFTKPNAYIAGQTAPGKGICIKASNINIGSDVIVRHVRFKRGLGVYGENTGNAMGMSGANHTIVDHCTAAWGTDETVSGRGAQNISFQYSGIFEALGITGHKNYSDGTNHGYAATIDGRIGSWHHNLLLNCEGRNWSMGGGMDANNIPIGGLDLFNNIVYNWYGRTTDGNCHNVNFVNNYYKMGADTRRTELFTQDFENGINVEAGGQDIAYVNGNIREWNSKKNYRIDEQKSALDNNFDKKMFNATGNIPTTYDYLVKTPLYESYATIHTAKEAMKIVTSYAGAFMPQRDNQHVRVVKETLSGTHTYNGSKSKIKGEIDNEADITDEANGGWEEWPQETRANDWDTDQDGMPDWWEQLIGSNPSVANQNDDPNGDGWTLLEDYLDFMAHPYLLVNQGATETLDVKPYFAGFYGQNSNYDKVTPTYSVATESNLFTPSINGAALKAVAGQNAGYGYINVTVDDGETQWTQRFGVAVVGQATGISELSHEMVTTDRNTPIFDLQGRRISKPAKGLYIQNGKKYIIR